MLFTVAITVPHKSLIWAHLLNYAIPFKLIFHCPIVKKFSSVMATRYLPNLVSQLFDCLVYHKQCRAITAARGCLVQRFACFVSPRFLVAGLKKLWQSVKPLEEEKQLARHMAQSMPFKGYGLVNHCLGLYSAHWPSLRPIIA